MDSIKLHTNSEEETIALGRIFGGILKTGDNVALIGPLGAGKTYFTKGIALGKGINDKNIVKSPSFTIINEYDTDPRIYHMDAYRLNNVSDLDNLGLDEVFSGNGIAIVEWGDKILDEFPVFAYVIHIKLGDNTERNFEIKAEYEQYIATLKELRRLNNYSS